jgi:chromosomal replication initiation ATPase DnaA
VKWESGAHRLSLPQIAKMVNRLDHTTICHALSQFDVYCRYDPEVRAVYAALKGMGC